MSHRTKDKEPGLVLLPAAQNRNEQGGETQNKMQKLVSALTELYDWRID